MCPNSISIDTNSLQCWNCNKKAIYKCPKCETRSCSLECVKKHKIEADCDGLRDKTKYVPLQKFTDMDVVNDFRLLEDVSFQVDKCKRDKLKRSTRQGTETMIAPKLNRHLQKLQIQAKHRKCCLKILPPHFTRRKENSSFFDGKNRMIKWHMVLKFINIDKKISLSAVSETTKLWQILSDFVEFKSADDPTDPFQIYRSVSYGGISLLLKSEALDPTGDTKQFHPLDMRRSIKSNLADKTIVEHPVIYVIFKSDEHMFREDDIVDDSEKKQSEEDHKVSEADVEKPKNIGDVMDETDAMQADPEAYKQYFDFYLKYYTQKYAQHGVSVDAPPPGNYSGEIMEQSGRNLMAMTMTQPPPGTPNYSTPPPRNNTYPLRQHNLNSPSHIGAQGYPFQPKNIGAGSTNFVNAKVSQPRDNKMLNSKNSERAQEIKSSFNSTSNKSLGSLVQYDMSDSDCD